jgi:hypothetical protein
MNKFVLLIGLLLGLASCRSTKITEPVYTKVPKVQILIESVQSAHFNFEWFSGKIAGKYKDDTQSFSFKGSIKIKKDSLIWMSISPGLGLELGRVLFDQDSLHFMNRFDKTYFKSSYADLSEKVNCPLTYARIQDLLTGNSLSDFDEKKYYSDLVGSLFKIGSVSEKQFKKLERSRRKFNQEIFTALVNPKTYKIDTQYLTNFKLNRKLWISYQDFEIHNNQYFAESIGLNISTKKELSLNLSYSRINLSKELKFSFKVPKSYEVIR